MMRITNSNRGWLEVIQSRHASPNDSGDRGGRRLCRSDSIACRHLTSRLGVTLIELAVVLSLVAVLIVTIASVFWGGMKVERADSAHLSRIQSRIQAFDQFRGDVHQASEWLAALDDSTASSSRLILKISDRHHVIYSWEGGRLSRMERRDGDELRVLLPLGSDRCIVEFQTGKDRDGLLRMLLVESVGRGTETAKRALEISACLGAGWK